MFQLLFAAALVDTVVAPPLDFETVYVHEWGAVTFCQEEITFGAVPDYSLPGIAQDPDQWDEPVTRAPVVYFYGAPFSGSFKVEIPSGSFIETMPIPGNLTSTSPLSSMEFNRAVWDIQSTVQNHTGITLGVVSLQNSVTPELLDIWRTPPSLALEFPGGFWEKFIYYEGTISISNSDDLYPVLMTDDGPVLHQDFTGPVAVFIKTREGIELELLNDESVPPTVYDDQSLHDFFVELMCNWAGGTMKSQEISAMWGTWEGWIGGEYWSGDTLLVFPLPAQTVESISTLTLETDQDYTVEYTRFHLGILSK